MGQRNGGGNESATQTKPHGNELIGNWKRKRKKAKDREKEDKLKFSHQYYANGSKMCAGST